MLLGDAYVEHAARIRLLEDAHRGAGGHCGRDAYDFGIFGGQFDHRMAEHVLEFHRGAIGMAFAAQRSCGGVEFAGGVPCGRVGLGGREPFPFSGLDVEQTRPAHPLDVVECLYERGYVVAVDRTEIAYVKTLEYILLARQQRFQTVVEAHDCPLLAVRHHIEAAQETVERISEVVVSLRGGDVSQVVVERAYIGVDRHVVVVEHNQQVVGRVGGVVQTLERQAAANGCVADYGHHVAPGRLAVELRRHGHAERRRNRVGGVSGRESVVFAFGRGGEAAESS